MIVTKKHANLSMIYHYANFAHMYRKFFHYMFEQVNSFMIITKIYLEKSAIKDLIEKHHANKNKLNSYCSFYHF